MVASAAAAAARNAARGSSGAGAAFLSSPVAGGWEAEAWMDVASSSGRMALKATVCSPGDSASSGETPPGDC
ncbi:hypothetical protein CA984_42535 [Streptosporangium minutum]|uniref:Uncharacterized protein n=1 Tax=Streptosporangium minutum TaxID=569862 RepID=A0A243QFW0_9ACTN|nr:hypothetical protein CA984_42535 [Streptosporangium minutum]